MKNKENKIFIQIYNEDSFEGIAVPKEFKPVFEELQKKYEDFIDCIYEDYDEYRDAEVESAHYARHGSGGTEDLETKEKVEEWINEQVEWKEQEKRDHEEYKMEEYEKAKKLVQEYEGEKR